MRVEKEAQRGYRVVIDSKTSIREIRGVTDMTLDGEVVTFASSGEQLAQLPLGASEFRKLRRKVWRADVMKKWSLVKLLGVGFVGAFAVYFMSLIVIGLFTYDEGATAGVAVQEEYVVEQPQVVPSQPSEAPKPWTPQPAPKPETAESWKP